MEESTVTASYKDTIVSYFESKMTPVVGWICLIDRHRDRDGEEERKRDRERVQRAQMSPY